MTAVEIVPVRGRRMLKQFIRFPFDLFKNCPQWVPAFEDDELKSLGEENPSLSFCERELYLARRDGKIVGRVAAILNRKANEKWKENTVRFGWIDFVEDFDVAKALVDAVIAWGRERGATKVKGPLGFTDMDREGLLVEGFEHDSPFTVIYNFPYYGEFLERMGFSKDVDWTQRYIDLPDTLPPMFQYADLVEKRYGLHIWRGKNIREMAKRGREMFHVLNDAFAPLYEYSKLTEEQIDGYVNFPFGFIPILRSLRHNDTIEALLIGVLPEYQGKGANVLMFKYIHENCIRLGIKRMLLNPQLEENYKVQSLFGEYDPKPFQRRRSYVMELEA